MQVLKKKNLEMANFYYLNASANASVLAWKKTCLFMHIVTVQY